MSEVTQLDRIEAMLKRLLMQTAPKRPGDDEKIFRDPKEKYWQGASFVGSKMSECPADYLRAYAKYKSACAYMGRKESDPSKLQYAERDEKTAAAALAWADWRDALGGDDSPTPAPAQEDFGTAADGGDLIY